MPGEFSQDTKPLRGEDRRHDFYIIDNVILDDYLSLMGAAAYLVYSLYCRMARNSEAWPGYKHICERLRIGKATLSECNKRLEALGLIEVKIGDRQRTNRYFVLAVEPLTQPVLLRIWNRCKAAGLDDLAEEVKRMTPSNSPVDGGENPPESPRGQGDVGGSQ